jgi:hypothetical protein
MPVAGPPGTPPEYVQVHSPLWQAVIPSKAASSTGDKVTPADRTEEPTLAKPTEERTVADRALAMKSLEPAVRRAWLSYEFAESKVGKRLEDREAYGLLKEEGIDGDKDNLGELTDYQLPAFDSWCRQLREARRVLGEQKYKRRGRPPISRSIVRADQVEHQKGEAD